MSEVSLGLPKLFLIWPAVGLLLVSWWPGQELSGCCGLGQSLLLLVHLCISILMCVQLCTLRVCLCIQCLLEKGSRKGEREREGGKRERENESESERKSIGLRLEIQCVHVQCHACMHVHSRTACMCTCVHVYVLYVYIGRV